MHHGPRHASLQRGFTLIELMIVVGVIGVLALIAFPSYQDTVRKGRRSDAMAGLTRLQQLQERYRGSWPSYASAAASMVGASTESPEKHYTLSVDASTASTYEMSATAKSTSPQFADTKCRKLTVKMDGGNMVTTSSDAAGTVDAANANRCWIR